MINFIDIEVVCLGLGLTSRLVLLLIDVEVAQLISGLVRGDHVQPVPKLTLLQKLLGQVLQVTLAEVDVGVDGDDGTGTGNGNGIAELSGLAIHFETVLQKILKSTSVKDLVVNGSGAVKGKLQGGLLLGNIVPFLNKMDGWMRWEVEGTVDAIRNDSIHKFLLDGRGQPSNYPILRNQE